MSSHNLAEERERHKKWGEVECAEYCFQASECMARKPMEMPRPRRDIADGEEIMESTAVYPNEFTTPQEYIWPTTQGGGEERTTERPRKPEESLEEGGSGDIRIISF